jgi:hypothetical protein
LSGENQAGPSGEVTTEAELLTSAWETRDRRRCEMRRDLRHRSEAGAEIFGACDWDDLTMLLQTPFSRI